MPLRGGPMCCTHVAWHDEAQGWPPIYSKLRLPTHLTISAGPVTAPAQPREPPSMALALAASPTAAAQLAGSNNRSNNQRVFISSATAPLRRPQPLLPSRLCRAAACRRLEVVAMAAATQTKSVSGTMDECRKQGRRASGVGPVLDGKHRRRRRRRRAPNRATPLPAALLLLCFCMQPSHVKATQASLPPTSRGTRQPC